GTPTPTPAPLPLLPPPPAPPRDTYKLHISVIGTQGRGFDLDRSFNLIEIMELASYSFQPGLIASGSGKRAGDVIAAAPGLSKKMSLANNPVYPRPEGQLSRHGSSDSRSSLTSEDSMPGMTDSSDSDTSFDEGSDYNTSASELWDTFWRHGPQVPGEQYPVLLRASATNYYFQKAFPRREHAGREADDDTTKLLPGPQRTPDQHPHHHQPPRPVATPASAPALAAQPSPPRPGTRHGSSPSYSVYPKPQPGDVTRVHLPPRTSSLAPAPALRRHALKPSKSSAHLHAGRPSAQRAHHVVPPPPPSPASPLPSPPFVSTRPPPSPPALRAAASAFNLREPRSPAGVAPPPVPQVPASAPAPAPAPSPARPSLERYVSVFDFDSDRESCTEGVGGGGGGGGSLTRRIARGFHKKSASEKRSTASAPAGARRGSADDRYRDGAPDAGKAPGARRRGGSLGRILGLRNR
ncbi:hypothetical protein GGS23DRAFT_613621, partial [Durotheca rogersii]|uniref:uncharacterized protein n=1 Tax=Durotheca rogersii TaxID=419775 RepID=UPI002220E7C0